MVSQLPYILVRGFRNGKKWPNWARKSLESKKKREKVARILQDFLPVLYKNEK